MQTIDLKEHHGVRAERRVFHRILIEAEVRLYSDKAMWSTRLLDISLKGALVERPLGWETAIGKTQRLEIRMNSANVISVNGRIARATTATIAFRFARLDLDSFIRLKRLVELNLGDVRLLHRELAALA